MDITYIPMARGFVYLAAVVDWVSRRVLAWRLSITMEAGFCVEALEEALARPGKPEIFNTDQGSQFTSQAFTGALIGADIAISMDGNGSSWRGNVFVERLWRTIKYEEVYRGPTTASAMPARRSAGIWASIISDARTPALTGKRRMRRTSIATSCRKVRQHELRRAFGMQLRSGYALPTSPPKCASHRPRKPGRNPLINTAKLFR
jgi:putative transposase